MRIWLVVLLLLASTTVSAQPYDTVVYGEDFSSCADGIPEPLTTPALEWVPSGEVHWFFEGEEFRALALAPGPRVYAAVRSGRGFFVGEINRAGVRQSITATIATGSPVATVVDSAGAIYVTYNAGTAGWVAAFDAGGSLRATYSLGARSGFETPGTVIDLAADQCTLFWVRRGVIARFNVCTGAALPDFATVQAPGPFAIRVLPDGGVLVSAGGFSNNRLERYDANGALVRSYPLTESVQAMTLTDGGTAVRYAETICGPAGNVVTMNLESGVVKVTADLHVVNVPETIVSSDGWTAAIGSAQAAAIPATGARALIAIAIALVVVGLLRLR